MNGAEEYSQDDLLVNATAFQGKALKAALADELAPWLFRLSFAYSSIIVLAEGSPAFAAQMAASQAALLHLARRLGVAVQLLTSSSSQKTQVRSEIDGLNVSAAMTRCIERCLDGSLPHYSEPLCMEA